MAAESVKSEDIIQELLGCSVDFVLTVPDTHQKVLTARLAADSRFQFLTACTEDEAIAIYAGLWISGRNPVLLVQHAGIFASINHLRGIAIDMRVPLFMLVGLLSRERDRLPRLHEGSMNHFIEPLLDTFRVPYFRMDGPADLPVIGQAHRLAHEREYPAAVLVGMPTI
jgi:sulfopyruvate decarboxylase TPP-binding subunit